MLTNMYDMFDDLTVNGENCAFIKYHDGTLIGISFSNNVSDD